MYIGNTPFQGLVGGSNILDASIEGVDLSTSAIAARLGYTPVDPGAATFTANPTISSGTANGIAYLNGSKVVSSSSNLTFTGSVLSLTGTQKITGGNQLWFNTTDNANYAYIQNPGAATGTNALGFYITGATPDLYIRPNGAILVGNGITSVTGAKLEVTGTISATGTITSNSSVIGIDQGSTGALIARTASATIAGTSMIEFYNKANRGLAAQIIASATGDFAFWTNSGNTNTVNISSTGLAVTGALSATGQITGRYSNGTVFTSSNGSDADFVLSLASGIVTQSVTGSLQLQTGGSNRAVISSTGLAVTGALSATGNLNITSPAFTDSIATINSTSTNVSQRLNFTANGTLQTQIYDDADQTLISTVTSKPLVFKTANTERLRITSTGLVALGNPSNTTANAWSGAYAYQAGNSANFYGDGIQYNWVAGISLNTYRSGNAWYNTSASIPTGRFEIGNGAGGSVGGFGWFWGSGGTAGAGAALAQLMTLDTSGRLLIGTTNSDVGGSVDGIVLKPANGIALAISGTGFYDYPLYADRRGTNNTGKILTMGLGGYLKASIGVVGTNNTANDGGITFNTIYNNDTQVQQMRIDVNGVGINYNAPEVRFEVNGGADGSVVFGGRSDGGNGNNRRFNLVAFADGGGANYGGGLRIQTRNSVNVFSNSVTIDSNGNIDVLGNINTNAGYVRAGGGSDPGSQLVMYTTSGGDGYIAAYQTIFNTGSNSARTERMRIGPTGRININNTEYTVIAGSVYGKTPNGTGFSFGYNPSGGNGESQLVWGNGGSTYPFVIACSDGTTTSNVARFTTTGNFSLGTNGYTNATGYKVVDIHNYASFGQRTTGNADGYMAWNAYALSNNTGIGGGYGYKQTGDVASLYTQNGPHNWWAAGSGTAGASIGFTRLLTLNENGILALRGSVLNAAGVGITFPETQVASADANTLDDYEEGTFTTAYLRGNNTAGSWTASYNTGRYTKVGRLVTYQLIVGGTLTGATGFVLVAGLPFPPNGGSQTSSVNEYRYVDTTGYTQVGMEHVTETDYAYLYLSGGGSQSEAPVAVSKINSSTILWISGSYYTGS